MKEERIQLAVTLVITELAKGLVASFDRGALKWSEWGEALDRLEAEGYPIQVDRVTVAPHGRPELLGR